MSMAMAIISVCMDTPKASLLRGLKLGLGGLFVIGLIIGVFNIVKTITEQPGHIVKDTYPSLQFSDYEVLYKDRYNGIFGGHTTYLLKISDEESDYIINNCNELGFERKLYNYKNFWEDFWAKAKTTQEALGLGKTPACYSSSQTREDRQSFILDNGYLYYHNFYL